MSDSLACCLEGRPFHTLLNGLSRRIFHADETMTHEYLVGQLFSDQDLEPDEIMAQIRIFEKLLHRAGQKNWDISKLEGILASSDIDPLNSRILLQFWSTQREKIHALLARTSSFNSHLSDFSWRVDVKTASKHCPEVNMPIAVVEFGLQEGYSINGGKNGDKTVRFGMDRDEIGAMIEKLESVQRAVESAAS